MNISLVLFVTLLAIIGKSEQKYVIPDIEIQVLKPKGLIVSIPDSDGLQQFSFHANINQEIKGKEDGTISKEVTHSQNGVWEIRDSNIQLKVGDKISYWVFVQYKRLGYDKQDQSFEVKELIDANSIPAPTLPICNPTATKVSGKTICSKDLIFEDTFSSFDENKWIREQYVAWKPDYEFNTYETNLQNNYISDGNVVFKATVRGDPESDVDLSNGCTRQTCQSLNNIVPPVVGAKMTSKFSFKYGKIEIRAQLPKGDWLYPILYLEPKDYSYGEDYKSGRIWLAYARGNQNLKTSQNDENIGNNVLHMGPVLGLEEPQRTFKAHKIVNRNNVPWGNDFHVFTIFWEPGVIRVTVDNEQTQDISPPYAYPGGPYSQIWTTQNAPFDKDFVISLGIAAGSVTNFPDGSQSNGVTKPWKRTDSKAPVKFYNTRNTWLNTWNGDNSALKIDYIRVWGL